MPKSVMRPLVDVARLHAFMAGIGRAAKGPGRVYLVGGSTALLLGFREQTIDIDIKLEPEPLGVFEAIAELKNTLQVNVELASPDQFIPAIPGWEQRSEFITRFGEVEFFHYDFYGQALAKILRNHEVDIADADALLAAGKIELDQLTSYYESIRDQAIRYPAINLETFDRRVAEFTERHHKR